MILVVSNCLQMQIEIYIIGRGIVMNIEYRRMLTEDIPSCAIELMKAFKELPWNENWTYEQA